MKRLAIFRHRSRLWQADGWKTDILAIVYTAYSRGAYKANRATVPGSPKTTTLMIKVTACIIIILLILLFTFALSVSLSVRQSATVWLYQTRQQLIIIKCTQQARYTTAALGLAPSSAYQNVNNSSQYNSVPHSPSPLEKCNYHIKLINSKNCSGVTQKCSTFPTISLSQKK